MREILSSATPSLQSNKERRKDHIIGIFSRSAEEDYWWLQTLLRSDGFSDCVQEVRSCYVSSSGFRQFHQDVSRCSFGILYHSKNRGRVNVTDVTDALYNDELRHLSNTLGKEKVMVVIDDLDDSGPDMRSRILQDQPSIGTMSQYLILFGKEEKIDREKYLSAIQNLDQRKLQEKLSVIKEWIIPPVVNVSEDERRRPAEKPGSTSFEAKCEGNLLDVQLTLAGNKETEHPPPRSLYTEAFNYASNLVTQLRSTQHTIGIFSRSSEEDYLWLQTLLSSSRFSHWVQEVRPSYVSSSGFRQFYEDVSQCSFGILYHSKNRGRINVTDVTDALYNDELRHLSDTLGRKNVLVVIDDLEDCSQDMRSRILQNQPSIERLAQGLILFSKKKKNLDENLKIIERLIRAADKAMLHQENKATSAISYPNLISSTPPGQEMRKYPAAHHSQSAKVNQSVSHDTKSKKPGTSKKTNTPPYQHNSNQQKSTTTWEANHPNDRYKQEAAASTKHIEQNFSTQVNLPNCTDLPSSKSFSPKLIIGIFSRSAEEDYSWLQTLLRCDRFSRRVREVRSCYVSSSGYRQFHQDVSRCSFGILYHTKNRGTINVTDVTSALYDDELRHLSDTLGRENVLVVIDDLVDSGPDARSTILQNQPSIGKLAGGLILCDRDKMRNSKTIDHLIKALNTLNVATKQEASTDSKTTQKISSSSQYGDDPGGSITLGSITSNRRHGGGDPSDRPKPGPKGSSPLWENNGQSDPSREEQEGSKNGKKSGHSSKRREDKAVESSGKQGGGWGVINFIKSTFQTNTQHDAQILPSTRHTVGIFSRSAEEDYSWLQTLLRSDGFSHCVWEVRSCYVSSSGSRQFHQDMSQCSFGILYHTKNRGRINVTDVQSALYDEELRHLSDTLGKQSVVVLIDDLEDSSSEQKTRILQNQPSIERLARNLILINNKSDKASLISPRELFYEWI